MQRPLNFSKFISKSKPPRLTTVLLFIFSLPALLLPISALADDKDPFNIIAGVAWQHDSNIFLVPSNFLLSPSFSRADNIATAYVGAQLDKLYSLQEFKANFTVTGYRYQNNTGLNFISKNYSAAWLWNLTPYLKGTLSIDRQQALNSFQDYRNFTSTTLQNVRVNQTQHFEADFSPYGVWHLLGGLTRTEATNSQVFFEQNNYSQNSLDAGVKYDFRSGSTLKLMGHERNGTYGLILNPINLFDTGFKEAEGEAKLDWLVTGKSHINLRVAYVSREHDHFSQRNYSGPEGRLDYNWTPTGKIGITFSAMSDLSSYWNLDSSYTRNNTLSISPVYAFSDKIRLKANASISERTFLGGGIIPSTHRVDDGRSASVGIDWTPWRSLTVGGNLVRSTRSSNAPGLDYDDTTVGVDANLLF
jgi:exopolysaccharide biosynthesis operon protein EpsL